MRKFILLVVLIIETFMANSEIVKKNEVFDPFFLTDHDLPAKFFKKKYTIFSNELLKNYFRYSV